MTEPSKSASSPAGPRPRRVLLVDDEPELRDALADLLREEGFAVDLAENGRVALERLQSARPDLLVMDLMMPVLDGWGVLEAIRTSCRHAAVPVIVLSAVEDAADPMPGVRWLRKPIEARDFLVAVRHAMPGSSA